MRKLTNYPDVLMQILSLLKNKLKPGQEVMDEDWNRAYEIIYCQNQIETIQMLIALNKTGTLINE